MAEHTVLIIDAHEDSRLIYGAVLEHHRFGVLAAGAYGDGLRLARERRPHLVLLELSPPYEQGWTAARKLRGDTATRDIPMVALSTGYAGELRARARDAGFASFLLKPCRPAELVEEVHRILGRRGHAVG